MYVAHTYGASTNSVQFTNDVLLTELLADTCSMTTHKISILDNHDHLWESKHSIIISYEHRDAIFLFGLIV